LSGIGIKTPSLLGNVDEERRFNLACFGYEVQSRYETGNARVPSAESRSFERVNGFRRGYESNRGDTVLRTSFGEGTRGTAETIGTDN
jgi:hypothetical protein